jgi:hypothetical protein
MTKVIARLPLNTKRVVPMAFLSLLFVVGMIASWEFFFEDRLFGGRLEMHVNETNAQRWESMASVTAICCFVGVISTIVFMKTARENKTLRGLLPICAHCKHVRDDDGYWHQVEVYVRDRTEAEFSHGICPKCMKELYPDVDV